MRIWMILVISAFAAACTHKPPRPANVLKRDEMVKILLDMYVAEEKTNRLGLPVDSAKKIALVLELKTLAKNNISDSTLRASINYYMDHPEEMEVMYTALVDSLNLKEQRQSIKAIQQ